MATTAVIDDLATDSVEGLSSGVAEERLERDGPNRLATPRSWVRLGRLGAQFSDVLIWLLLIAAAVSGILLGAWVDAGAIVAIVLLNAALGYFQESKADRALKELEQLAAPEASVIRDGVLQTLEASRLVRGDVVILEAGDGVPADARLVAAVRMQVAESTLTGESLPVEKTTEPVPEHTGVVARTSMVFTSTAVVAGRGRAVVVATGGDTEVGKIASLVAGKPPPTPLQIELARVGRRLALVAVTAAGLIFGAGIARSYPVETMFLTAVALAVAAIPEGLPAVVTVSLSSGVQRMAKRGAIVRRLPAVEALGAVDVVCTDKTGTLTRNDLRVQTARVAGRDLAPDHFAAPDDATRQLTTVAAVCNDASPASGGVGADAMDVALIHALDDAGVDVAALRRRYPRLDELGFTSSRKRMSVLCDAPDGFAIMTKGAPEVLIARSRRVRTSQGFRELDAKAERDLLTQVDRYAAAGLRTLGFATRTLDRYPADTAGWETDLDFVGMIGLSDPVRPEARAAVEEAYRAGVSTVMVTGDHTATAGAVARAVGIRNVDVVHGSVLSEVGLDGAAELTDVVAFARVDPVDKVAIVRAHQANGSLVAMTGDGVNDAPALRNADIGVAMGSGTDVARESSDLVLVDDNYATIVAAIREGRRIFGNLRNVVHYLLSANASEVIYMVVGFLAFGFLGQPLLAVQLLWINLLSDALPALALGLDEPSHDLMKDPPGAGRDILSRNNLALLLGQGVILAAATVTTMLVGHYVLDLVFEVTRTMAFTTLVLAQLVHAINVRSAGDRLSAPQASLIGAILVSLLMQLAVIYLPVGNSVFDTAALGPTEWLWILIPSAASFGLIRLMNRAASRRGGSARTRLRR